MSILPMAINSTVTMTKRTLILITPPFTRNLSVKPKRDLTSDSV